ncbi:unnamed protein product [Didymodactylos carnosus]|uniref:Uncharacterized protein n=1 Tax=Didymodactylos carnosus TaxID=1234261 RepID=A0A813X2D8_9BILA|nr:unnamed protein product [Didymodactylos carnosus]CAF3651088.1 unnamed protein product [Didymodactylos carnosus]
MNMSNNQHSHHRYNYLCGHHFPHIKTTRNSCCHPYKTSYDHLLMHNEKLSSSLLNNNSNNLSNFNVDIMKQLLSSISTVVASAKHPEHKSSNTSIIKNIQVNPNIQQNVQKYLIRKWSALEAKSCTQSKMVTDAAIQCTNSESEFCPTAAAAIDATTPILTGIERNDYPPKESIDKEIQKDFSNLTKNDVSQTLSRKSENGTTSVKRKRIIHAKLTTTIKKQKTIKRGRVSYRKKATLPSNLVKCQIKRHLTHSSDISEYTSHSLVSKRGKLPFERLKVGTVQISEQSPQFFGHHNVQHQLISNVLPIITSSEMDALKRAGLQTTIGLIGRYLVYSNDQDFRWFLTERIGLKMHKAEMITAYLKTKTNK